MSLLAEMISLFVFFIFVNQEPRKVKCLGKYVWCSFGFLSYTSQQEKKVTFLRTRTRHGHQLFCILHSYAQIQHVFRMPVLWVRVISYTFNDPIPSIRPTLIPNHWRSLSRYFLKKSFSTCKTIYKAFLRYDLQYISTLKSLAVHMLGINKF